MFHYIIIPKPLDRIELLLAWPVRSEELPKTARLVTRDEAVTVFGMASVQQAEATGFALRNLAPVRVQRG